VLTSSILTIAYGTIYGSWAWLIYTIPFGAIVLVARRYVKERQRPESIDDKDFSKSGDALESLVREAKKREEK